MATSNTVLKVIFCVQLLLTTWAAQSTALFSPAYMYINAIVMLFGAYAIVNSESSEAVFMYFCGNIGLIVSDIIFLGIYNARNYEKIVSGSDASVKSEYQFSLAMAIINLIVRPIAAVFLYRVYQDRVGLTGFTLPGMPQTSSSGSHGGYEDMSRPRTNLPGFGPQSLGSGPSGASAGMDKQFSNVDQTNQPALLASLN